MIMASSNRPIILPNADCVYCGVEFSEFVPFETEHVVARRFVPKGTLDGQWNLLLRSCRRCNGDKSTLENDISAISMQPDASGKFVNADPRLQDEATRKAKRSVSQKTGKPVVLGEEPVKFGGNFGGAKFDFSFSMPPQVNDDRLFRLAHYQIAAFFYWTTFDQTTGRGSFLPGKFRPLVAVRKADWGHPQMRWFIKLTEHWSWRVYGVCAQGYYR